MISSLFFLLFFSIWYSVGQQNISHILDLIWAVTFFGAAVNEDFKFNIFFLKFYGSLALMIVKTQAIWINWEELIRVTESYHQLNLPWINMIQTYLI